MDGVHLFKREGSYVYVLPEAWRLNGFHTRIAMMIVGQVIVFRVEYRRNAITDDSSIPELTETDIKWFQATHAYDAILESQLTDDQRLLFFALRAGELRGDFEAQAVHSLYWSLVVEDILEHGFLKRCLPKARAFYDQVMTEENKEASGGR
jgi:hypothetical protein